MKTTSNDTIVPFDYQQKIVGSVHRWLGHNELHDKISLYSFSWLFGGKMTNNKKGLNFPDGATFFISFFEDQYPKKIIKSILSDPDMFCGLTIKDVTIAEQPSFSEEPQTFRLASPILIKRVEGESKNCRFYFYDNEESKSLLTETLKHKMKEAGLPEDDSLEIKFDLNYPNPQIKLVTINDIKNKASMCPIIIYGKPETKLFAWTVGVGHSTGVSFGALI